MRGPFGSPNDLAAFLLFALPLAVAGWLTEKKWSVKSIFWVLMLALFSLSFLMTLSRGAFFGLVLALGLVLISSKNKKAFFALAFLLALFTLSSPILRQSVVKSLQSKDITITQRLLSWKTAANMIQTHPFLGNGVNMYYQKSPSFYPESKVHRGYPHNCYLQMWSEIGIFGLISFLIPLLVYLLKSIINSGASSTLLQKTLFVGTVAFLIQAFVDTHFYALQPSFLFWIFWALFIASQKSGLQKP